MPMMMQMHCHYRPTHNCTNIQNFQLVVFPAMYSSITHHCMPQPELESMFVCVDNRSWRGLTFPRPVFTSRDHLHLHRCGRSSFRSFQGQTMFRVGKHQNTRPDSLRHHHPLSFGGSHFNVQVASERIPHWAAMVPGPPVGLPVVEPSWTPQDPKRNMSWHHLPRPLRRASSPLSITATASDSRPPSLVMDGSESKTSSTTTSCMWTRSLTLSISKLIHLS